MEDKGVAPYSLTLAAIRPGDSTYPLAHRLFQFIAALVEVGEGQGQGGDEGGAAVAQEQQDHQHRHDHGIAQGIQHVGDGQTDEPSLGVGNLDIEHGEVGADRRQRPGHESRDEEQYREVQ
jgi:hypothetical protein